MKISLEISGGFFASPAMSAPTVIDTAAIDPKRASEVEAIVQDVSFFQLPRQMTTAPSGAADHFVYTLEIKDGDHEHTVVLTDPIPDDGLVQLIHIIRTEA